MVGGSEACILLSALKPFQHVPHLGFLSASRVKLPMGSFVFHLPLSEPCQGKAGGKAQDEAGWTRSPSHLVEGQIWGPMYAGYRLMPQLLLPVLQIRQR